MVFLFITLLLLLVASFYSWRSPSKLPPGPQGLPIIGNIHQISRRYPWKQFQQWHKVYGPLFSIRAGQITLIILGTHEVARDLLTRRSLIYSSRPRLVVAQECLAKGFGAALLPYGPIWKQNHKIQMLLLNSRRCQLYRPLQDLESRHLLYNLLSTNRFEHELHRYSSSLIFTLLYGKRFVTGKEAELEQIERLAIDIVGAVSFGNCLVDIFPVLNWVPRFLAKWKRVGDDFHWRQTQLYERNTDNALHMSAWNWTKQSFLEEEVLLSRKELTFVLGEIFEAGSHTTAGALIVAVLACVSYPDAMRCAQAELDSYVGKSRLPNFDDLAHLPYTRAFVEETLRWRPLAPGGVPHSPIANDTYRGFSIPKGAAIVANHWSLDMDEDIFQTPADFIPERWINDSNLPLAAFGFGRRACPGQHLARNSLLLVVSRLLWTFDIKWKDGQEQQLKSSGMTHEGIFSKPCSFEATFTVRSAVHEQTVRSGWEGSNNDAAIILDTIGASFSVT